MTTSVPEFVGLAIGDDAFAHRSILASAGSGKTHALTTRYLQLVAAGASPSTILASTFTRLAAGEIRDRVLNRLSDAARDPGKRAALAAELALVDASKFTQDAAATLLARLVQRLHVLQLRTLDSFFASVVRASEIELGLPIGAEVIDEEQEAALRSEAIALMLSEHNPEELVELLRQLTRGDAGRSVTEAIDSVVKSLYDLARDSSSDAWNCVPELPGRLKNPEVITAIDAIEAIPAGRLKSHNKAVVDDVRRARDNDWETFITKGIASSVACGKPKYGNGAIDPAWIPVYEPLVAHAKAIVIGKLRAQTLATRSMILLFHQQLERLKQVRGVVTFSDLVQWCQKAIQHDTLETIAYRLDAAVRHLLLDEFQDTSIAQWEALQPIVEQVAATAPPERSLFCVGDVKQSIYGWRGAAPEVLQKLPEFVPGIDVQPLAKSYRSSPVIIECVNRVFSTLAANPALNEHVDTANAWLEGFTKHESAKRKRPGHVQLHVVERRFDGRSARKPQTALRLRQAADFAANLLRSHPDTHIGILVRKNAHVARMLLHLGPGGHHVHASGRGGGPVIDAPAVNALLDLLRLVDHPNDTTAAFNIVCSPLGAVVGLRDFKDVHVCERVARRVRRELQHDGFAMTLARLARELTEHCDPREIRRVLQLVELAGRFDAQPSLRADDFVAMAEMKKMAPTQPARIEVMTVHQAKGLDFDVVVLPDLDFRLNGEKTTDVMYERAGEIGPITRICRHISKDLIDFVPELKPLRDGQERRTVRESLSLLYVAMTRAKFAMHLFIDEPSASEGKISATAANVVRCALADDHVQGGTVAFEAGDAGWFSKRDEPAAAQPSIDVEAEAKPIRLAPTRQRHFDRAPSPSALVEKTDAVGGVFSIDSTARDRGTAIHGLAQQIEWLDDFNFDDAALSAFVRLLLPRREAEWITKQVRDFRMMLKAPEIASLLTRPAGFAGSVRREIPFARLTREGVQNGTIDRLVIEHHGEPIARTHIIDFKTDVVAADQVEAYAQRYRPQLHAYRDAVAEMLGIDASAITMSLAFLHAGRVVDVA